MKKFALFFWVFFLVPTAMLAQAEEDGIVVAMVGKVPITIFELNRMTEQLVPPGAQFHGGVSQERRVEISKQAIEKLIEMAYKVQYALDEEIPVDSKSFEKKVESAQKRFYSKEQYLQFVKVEGEDRFRASLYREALAEAAEDHMVVSKVNVTEMEIYNYYEKNKSSFIRPYQFRASHIAIKVDPSLNQEEKEKLFKKSKDILSKAKSGEDFYNLAYFYSDDRSKFVGGDLGLFHENQADPAFESALKEMQPGDIAGPIKTWYGYHIVKLVEKNEPRQFTFEEIRSRIKNNLEEQKYKQLYDAWMKALVNRYEVVRFVE